MRWFRFVVLIMVVAILQAGLLAHWDIKPDLLVILLVFFAIYCKTKEGIITSFLIGFAADIIGPVMGPQIISFGLWGTALSYLHRVITIKKRLYQGVAIFITCFLAGYLSNLLNLLKGQSIPLHIHRILLNTSVFSAVLGPFLFLPVAWWMRIKINRLKRY